MSALMTSEDPLVQRAREAALQAYAPYSGFSVGCAVESVDGEVAVGANMENACYRLGVCAELAALTAAQQAFGIKAIKRIAVAGGHVGRSEDPLVQRAREAALQAYAPYSGFSVGCAVESVDGEVAVGANMENACYRLGVCAELAALTAAQQAFGIKAIKRIAVAGGHVGGDGHLAGGSLVTSCGGCRQSILEAAQ